MDSDIDWVKGRFVIRPISWHFRIVCISDKHEGKVVQVWSKKATGGNGVAVPLILKHFSWLVKRKQDKY
jgi:hypothetical protein